MHTAIYVIPLTCNYLSHCCLLIYAIDRSGLFQLCVCIRAFLAIPFVSVPDYIWPEFYHRINATRHIVIIYDTTMKGEGPVKPFSSPC